MCAVGVGGRGGGRVQEVLESASALAARGIMLGLLIIALLAVANVV